MNGLLYPDVDRPNCQRVSGKIFELEKTLTFHVFFIVIIIIMIYLLPAYRMQEMCENKNRIVVRYGGTHRQINHSIRVPFFDGCLRNPKQVLSLDIVSICSTIY